MSLPAQSEVSVTLAEQPKRRDEARPVATLLLVGEAERILPPEPRLIPFERALHIGRRAPADASIESVWVIKDRLVSGQHCVIEKEGDSFQLRDLNSRNGTTVDGVPVREPVKLRDGAIIFVGAQVAVFRMISPTEIDAIRQELRAPLGPVPTMSPSFAAGLRTLGKLAASDCELLLAGETGVGKEVYAHAVHRVSGRQGRFVAINCAALPRELVESELFGYVRGAHSQARESKRGLIEEADGGTLFLDEIGEMPPELQTKLLRFLQDRELTPLGATRGRPIDVRILAATSRTSAPTATSGGLRGDLAARLGAQPIVLPPLRHRIEDLGTLAAFFLREHDCAFDTASFQALALHSWPGNVRELAKALSTAELLARGSDLIEIEHLPTAVAEGHERVRAAAPAAGDKPPAPNANELRELLRRFNGNVYRVSREVDRAPALIYRWCRRYKLDPESFRPKE